MLRFVPAVLLYLGSRVIAIIASVSPKFLAQPLRSIELRMLYRVSRVGPGGFDDAVQIMLMRNASVYAGPTLTLLLRSTPGSVGERVALAFIEDVRVGSDLDQALKGFGEQHADPSTRRLVESILLAPPRGRRAP